MISAVEIETQDGRRLSHNVVTDCGCQPFGICPGHEKLHAAVLALSALPYEQRRDASSWLVSLAQDKGSPEEEAELVYQAIAQGMATF